MGNKASRNKYNQLVPVQDSCIGTWKAVLQELKYEIQESGQIQCGNIMFNGFHFQISGPDFPEIPVLIYQESRSLKNLLSAAEKNNTLIKKIIDMKDNPDPEFKYLVLGDGVIKENGKFIAGILFHITKNSEHISDNVVILGSKNRIPVSESEISSLWNRNKLSI